MVKLKNSQKYGTIRLNQRDKSEFIEMIGGNAVSYTHLDVYKRQV